MKTRVLFFGTHPKQFNGYSKVVYEIMKGMSAREDDYEFFVYGFQNAHSNPRHRLDLPKNVTVYDAQLNENPKKMGFGITEIKDFVSMNKPDICIVYNDMIILHQVISQLVSVKKENDMNFKILAYVDQIYLNQKKVFIDFINENVDRAMLFTEDWEKCIVDQGLKVPTCYLPHGINKMTYFPIEKKLARQYFNMKADDFLILNLNRNQPRKRWDTCIKAFAEIVSKHLNDPIKMIIGTAVQGAWNLLEMYERELKKRGVSIEDGIKHIIMLDRPQQMSDEETNILYNVADVGINTCDGEGFGLCNFEQAAIGIPQIIPRLGGFTEFFDEESVHFAEPTMAYYVDNSRDMVCGEALLCDYNEYVSGIEMYYQNAKLRKDHGEKCRDRILKNYSWEIIIEKMCSIIDETLGINRKEKVEKVGEGDGGEDCKDVKDVKEEEKEGKEALLESIIDDINNIDSDDEDDEDDKKVEADNKGEKSSPIVEKIDKAAMMSEILKLQEKIDMFMKQM